MPDADDPRDQLAHDLVDTDFDAVERDGLRAAWTDGDTTVTVEDVETGAVVRYDGEDLVRATSEQEVTNARTVEEFES